MGAKKLNLNAVKKELQQRKQELEQELTGLYQEKFSDDQVQDQGDQALSSTMESFKSSFQNTKLDDYKRVKQALEMIENGTYGICIDCQEPIKERRLASFPNATRCLICQEQFEEKGF